MTRIQPMLDQLLLQHVQHVELDDHDVIVQHGVPAREGDVLQSLRRRAARIRLAGVLTGPDSRDGLRELRVRSRAGTPVSFVADVTTTTRIDQVLIAEMAVREVAGKPERYEYAFDLREFIAPPPTPRQGTLPETSIDEAVSADAQQQTEETVSEIAQDQGELSVRVEFEDGTPDFSNLQVLVEGESDTGEQVRFVIEQQTDGVYSREEVPAGDYTVSVFRS